MHILFSQDTFKDTPKYRNVLNSNAEMIFKLYMDSNNDYRRQEEPNLSAHSWSTAMRFPYIQLKQFWAFPQT